jgi:Lipopolysaccharide-assembly
MESVGEHMRGPMVRRSRTATRRSAALVAGGWLWIAAGCGYNFAGTGNRLPADVHTISIGPIQNSTREVGLDKQLSEALEDEVVSRGRLKVVPQGQGEAVLAGTIRNYLNRPISFSARDEALQYQASLDVDLELRRTDNGKLLWKSQGQRAAQDYSAVPGVVVTTSSQFQSTTLNPQNVNQFTDISLSESQRRQANEAMIETLARDVYNQMMEDF